MLRGRDRLHDRRAIGGLKAHLFSRVAETSGRGCSSPPTNRLRLLTCSNAGAKDHDVSSVRKPKLEALLAAHPPGTWLVLDPRMSRLLGAGKTPKAAMRKAHIPLGMSGGPDRKRPVILQVVDPTVACFF
jgi:hypothetical protein